MDVLLQVPLRNASLSALTRRTSLPVGQYRDDVMKDEDSLLRSKWSIEMFPELVADRSQHDLHLLGRWLQVCAVLEQCPCTWHASPWHLGVACIT